MNGHEGAITDYIQRLKGALDSIDIKEIDILIEVIRKAYEEERRVFIMGNGGSAATASHIVCDLNKGASHKLRKRFNVVSLNDNIPSMLAIANDMDYESVFVEQLKNFLSQGDVVIGISGSGNSGNVIKAIEYANRNGGVTVGLCGYSGGELKKITRHAVHVKIDDMQISEDIHLVVGHMMMKIFKGLLERNDAV